jgi:ATP-dependent Clp protease ATP-binding subunit ClpB
VDFKNTVVIMTSNVGTEFLDGREAETDEQRRDLVMAALRQHFRPEFLNRVDEIIIFHGLTKEHLKEIVEIQVSRLKQLLADRRLEIELTEAAKALLAEEGYDPAYGARPLKRVIQRQVQDPLALRLLEGEYQEGDRVLVDAMNGHLTFEPVRQGSAAPEPEPA